MAALTTRIVSVLLTTIMVVGLTATSASAGSYESDALVLLNADRAAAGLPPVAMHYDLTDDALAWSLHMHEQDLLSHNPNLAAVNEIWDKLGENVGVGTSISTLHTAFMASPGHRANILGDYDYVGIAVVEETSTKLWITVVFMKSLSATPAPPPSSDDPEPYAEQQPAVTLDEPVGSQSSARIAAVASTPASQPGVHVVFVRAGASPIAD